MKSLRVIGLLTSMILVIGSAAGSAYLNIIGWNLSKWGMLVEYPGEWAAVIVSLLVGAVIWVASLETT